MTLGDVISEYRRTHELSMDKFSDISGISKAYISMLERNRTQRGDEPSPSIEIYRNVANVIGVDVDELIRTVDGKIKLVAVNPTSNIAPIRFLGEVAAGYDHIANEEYEYLNIPEEWLGGRKPSDFFAMRVVGSSMYPMYCDGDEVLCLSCNDMGQSGRVGVIVYGDGEATLKRIEFANGEDWVDLVPINPEYQTKRIEGCNLDSCRVIGRAMRLIRTVGVC